MGPEYDGSSIWHRARRKWRKRTDAQVKVSERQTSLSRTVTSTSDGNYEFRLPRGVYEYKFVINGTDMISDPTNLRTTGALGNSVLTLGGD